MRLSALLPYSKVRQSVRVVERLPWSIREAQLGVAGKNAGRRPRRGGGRDVADAAAGQYQRGRHRGMRRCVTAHAVPVALHSVLMSRFRLSLPLADKRQAEGPSKCNVSLPSMLA